MCRRVVDDKNNCEVVCRCVDDNFEKKMLKGISLAVLCFGLLVSVCAEDHGDHDAHEHEDEHGHADHGAWTLDPYHEVLRFLNISEEKGFTVDKLDDLLEHLNERLRCEDHEHDEHDEHDEHNHEHEHDEHGEDEHADEGGDDACNKTIVRFYFSSFFFITQPMPAIS